ncbi:protein of unassigned function [Methylobacterium oryzae CBMB20]|uniref:Protein of unassigned function n=1 Tax=Methylobacterium oryzae CBMB20 TaxID=693986 RepID=A0A089P3J9_9HYPH|nr:protein of unassigned function [Methylobacterium oryzae CBMB20]
MSAIGQDLADLTKSPVAYCQIVPKRNVSFCKDTHYKPCE